MSKELIGQYDSYTIISLARYSGEKREGSLVPQIITGCLDFIKDPSDPGSQESGYIKGKWTIIWIGGYNLQ